MGSSKESQGWETNRVEQFTTDEKADRIPARQLALDPHGFALRPQPSSDPHGARSIDPSRDDTSADQNRPAQLE